MSRVFYLLLVGVAALLAPAGDAFAQAGRARMSRDLAERLKAGDYQETSVIVSGSQGEVNALAARHGLRVGKRLETGAVLVLPPGALGALAADPDAPYLATNQTVRADMSVTNHAG